MKSRLVASLALSALVLAGATGCSMISPQATTIDYSASDGANVPKSGPIEVLNAFLVVNKKGTTGNLVAGLVNATANPATIQISIGNGPIQSVRVPAGKTVSLGGADSEPLRFDKINVRAGATQEVYFQSGNAEGVKYAIPVLDGTLPYYATLVPTPPKPTPTPTPTPTITPTPTPSPSSGG